MRASFLLVSFLTLSLAGCGSGDDSRQALEEGKELVGDNAEQLEELDAMGSDLGQPHLFEFYAVFPARSGADAAASTLKARGYTTSVQTDGDVFLLTAALDVVPAEPGLTAREQEVADAAKPGQGVYDGFDVTLPE